MISLRMRIIAFVVVAMAMVASERVVSIFNLHEETLGQARSQAMELVEQGVSHYEQQIAATDATLSTLGTDAALTQATAEPCRRLRRVVEITPGIEALALIDTEGSVTCSSAAGGQGLDLSDREYVRMALQGVANLGTVRQSYVLQTPAIIMAMPVIENDGEVLAVVAARVGLSELFPDSFAGGLSLSSQALIVDPDGVAMRAEPDNGEFAGQDLRANPVVSRALSRSSGSLIAAGPDGITRIYGFTRLPRSNLHLIVGLDMSVVTRELERATWLAAAALIAALTVALIGLWLVGETLIVAPVQRLSQRLTLFGRGESAGAAGHDDGTMITELAPLVSAFEAMADELTRREGALREANRQLNSLASLDALTGIANRRSFDAVLALQWSTARHFALLMIDVDHFKPFNDHFGHPEGDRCLRVIAGALAGAVRASDIAARIGGEEFAVLMPGTTLPVAMEVAERLRGVVEGLQIAHASEHGGVVTVSIGAAACAPKPGLGSADLVIAADHALYAAKEAGRNRIRAAAMVGSGQPARGEAPAAGGSPAGG